MIRQQKNPSAHSVVPIRSKDFMGLRNRTYNSIASLSVCFKNDSHMQNNLFGLLEHNKVNSATESWLRTLPALNNPNGTVTGVHWLGGERDNFM